MKNVKLTEKQKRFCDEYLIDLNATRAYKAAGYSVRSDNAAGVEGHKLLRNPKIDFYLKGKMKEIIIHDIRISKRFGDGVYKHIVDFELENTNISGKYTIESDRELTSKETKELISKEIYDNNIDTLTTIIDLDTTEFKGKISELEDQLERLVDRTKDSTEDVFKIYRETISELESIGDDMDKKITNKLAKDNKAMKHFILPNGEQVIPIKDIAGVASKALEDHIKGIQNRSL